MTQNSALSQIHMQIMWNRLIAVVEEQAQTLIRTAFSNTVREAGDLSAGVFDLQGRMLAQAVTGTPGHVNAMAASVAHFLAKFPPAGMREGDVFITNNPWQGTGHLHDFTVVSPTFRNNRIAGLFACTSHVVDVGGRGWGTDARQVFEEGLHVPIMPLASQGKMNEMLLEIVRTNVREPITVEGDLYSLAACNEAGSRRLVEMMDEFDLETLDGLGRHIIENSTHAMLQEIRALPAGVYRNHLRVDGYDQEIDLVAAMTIGPSGIDVDFTGTSGESPRGINVPLTYTQAYASFGVRCLVGAGVPNNAGSLGTVRVSAPAGSILNAQPPAAVGARHILGHFLPDTMLGCLYQAAPGRTPAEGASCLWNALLYGGHGFEGANEGPPGPSFMLTCFHAGGAGARPSKDGLNATAFPSGVRNTPLEVNEAISPIVFTRKEYRGDSGGPGQQRGGVGQIMEFTHASGAPFVVSAMFDRVKNPARGRSQGKNGAAGRVATGAGRKLNTKGQQLIPAGDKLVLEMPGGGGYGDPLARDPAAVALDARDGLVSRAAARREYGVVLTASFRVNAEATAKLRAERPQPAAE